MINMRIYDFMKSILQSDTPITKKDPDHKNSLKFYPRFPGIFIPEMTLEEYFISEREIKEGFYAMKEITKKIVSVGIFKPKQSFNEKSIVAFYLLHEEGHWVHFKEEYLEYNKTHNEFLNDYRKQDDYCKYKYLVEAESLDINTKHEIHARIYRENKFEEKADLYAIDKIKNDETILKFFK